MRRAAAQRAAQVALALAAFELLRAAPVATAAHALVAPGTCLAVALHAAHALSPYMLMRRRRHLCEGNHGGLYYALSLFVALEYHRRRRVRTRALVAAACSAF